MTIAKRTYRRKNDVDSNMQIKRLFKLNAWVNEARKRKEVHARTCICDLPTRLLCLFRKRKRPTTTMMTTRIKTHTTTAMVVSFEDLSSFDCCVTFNEADEVVDEDMRGVLVGNDV